jgi:hypothetical protein
MERLGRITTSLPDLPIDRRMTYGAMRRAIIGLPVTVSSAILPDELWGCYDATTDVILIDRRLTYAAKRCTLVHELMHWRHGDAACDRLGRGREERRARRESALFLVEPMRYGLLEQMYDGNSWNIAQELEVTQQVLGDFRQVMAERVSII